MARTAIARVFRPIAAVLLLAASARAQSVHEVVAGGDAVSGTVSAAGEVDRIPVRLVEGALVSVSLKAAKGSTLLPDFVLLGPDREPDGTVAGLLKVNGKGNVLSVKNLPVSSTGLRWIEIRGKNGTTGGWTLATKVKLPKGVTGAPTITKSLGATSFPFPVPGNATATLTVAAAKGSTAFPAFGGLTDPAGAAVPVDEVLPGRSGFVIRNLFLAKPGTYTLSLLPGTGGDGGVAVTLKWKIPKPLKRALLESQVITDPIAMSLSPDSGNTSQVVPFTVSVDFAKPGAKVRFSKPPTVITAQGSGVAVDDDGISFVQSLLPFQKGVYDVEVENPDGGKSVLQDAFTVANAPATLTMVTPTFGYDNQAAVQVVVGGAFINGGATCSLVRGGTTIPGTGVSAVSNSLSATFDLRGRAIGAYDVVVTNPDAAPTTLAAAFEVRNSPPVVTAISPSSNVDGALVACTIDGTDFDSTPTAVLRRTGQSDIPGTSLVLVSGTQITCSFDTAGKAVGAWNLVVTNPDGAPGTLVNAFSVSGAVAPAAKSFSPAGGGNADAPPSICWNGTRNELAVAWVEENSGSYEVKVQRLDPTGSPLGSAASVSSAASTVPKRDAVVAWDSTNDQYLCCWSETISITVGTTHPSANYTSVYTVRAQRLQGSDLSALGSNVQVTDNTVFSGFVMQDFNNIRPDACWNPAAGKWEIVFTQEWSTQNVNGYGFDDWDVIRRGMNASSTLDAAFTGVAITPQHEGDASILYSPATSGVVVAWSYRGTLTSALSGVVQGTTIASDSNDTQDLRMAYDPDASRIVITWTKSPTGATKFVQGAVLSGSSPGTIVGSAVTIASGSDDHFLARPVYNPVLKQALVSWTRKAATGGGLTVRSRRATTGTASGLVLVGSELESSSGSSDEAMPACAYSGTAGESVVLWLKTMSFVNVNGFAGSVLNGIYRGKEFWMVRYR
jgi:hypothetical protein